ncbi:MAG: hypothetical protein ACK4UO_04430 [Pseudolabrys sp.]
MDLKLTILFVLIGVILGLSHLDALSRHQRLLKRWRQFVPVRTKARQSRPPGMRRSGEA